MKKGAASLFTTMIAPGAPRRSTTTRSSSSSPSRRRSSCRSCPRSTSSTRRSSRRTRRTATGAAPGCRATTPAPARTRSRASIRPIGFVAKRFPGHFMGWGPKYIDEIEFRLRQGRQHARARPDQGRLQRHRRLPADRPAQAPARGAATSRCSRQESMRVMMMQINNQRAPLNDVHVRRAINYAFDYDGFNKEILGGLVERNPTPLPNTIWGVPKDVKGYSFDIDKAKARAGEGRGQGRPADHGRLPHRLQPDRAGRPVLANGLRKIGVEIEGDRRAVADDRRAVEEARDHARHRRLLDLHLLRRPHNWIGEMFHSGQWGTFKAVAATTRTRRWTSCWTRRCKSTDRQGARRRSTRRPPASSSTTRPGLWIYNTKWYGPYSKKLKGIASARSATAQEMRWLHYSNDSEEGFAPIPAVGTRLGALRPASPDSIAPAKPALEPASLGGDAIARSDPAAPGVVRADAAGPARRDVSSSRASFRPIRWRCWRARRRRRRRSRRCGRSSASTGRCRCSSSTTSASSCAATRHQPLHDAADLGGPRARLPATIELTIAAMVIAVVIGIPLGVVSALWRNSLLDHVLRIVTVSGLAIASFWLASCCSCSSPWARLAAAQRPAHGLPAAVDHRVLPARRPAGRRLGRPSAARSRTWRCPPSRSPSRRWPRSCASRAPACSTCCRRTSSLYQRAMGLPRSADRLEVHAAQRAHLHRDPDRPAVRHPARRRRRDRDRVPLAGHRHLRLEGDPAVRLHRGDGLHGLCGRRSSSSSTARRHRPRRSSIRARRHGA